MRVHILVDYSFLYYKYYFQLKSGKMRRLITDIAGEEKDVSQIYYSIREIEGFRRNVEKYGHNVIVSVCFDMPSARKQIHEGATEAEIEAITNYKSNRVKRLTDEDFQNIEVVEQLLSDAGHNTYRIEGYEADDIISNLIRKYKDNFDYSIIYTPDADLMVNICNKVGVQRYKVGKGYEPVDLKNYSDYLSKEFKCYIPYNALMLYKCTCGDKSDVIKGIDKFGPKAFDKLVDYLNGLGVIWEECGSYEKTLELLDMCKGYLTDEQIEQAKESLSLVRPMIVEDKFLIEPVKKSNRELRESSYMQFGMKSLID